VYAELKRFLNMEILRRVHRAQALRQWQRKSFAGVPVIFGNSMPKSGSHLLLQILKGMSSLGPFVETGGGPVRTITIKGRLRPQAEISADLRRFWPGDIGWGYLRATPENIACLARPDWASYFILRDPRDMLVSHVYYASDMYEGHGMHAYYQTLPFEQRLAVAIGGIDNGTLKLPNVRTRYERMLAFFDQPRILTIHFEDLILKREQTLGAMLDHLERAGFRPEMERAQAVEVLMEAINPKKSSTFRKGRVGDWKEHFSAEHKRLFKEVTGDLLVCLGYEQDNGW
jgi:hypothetical protein